MMEHANKKMLLGLALVFGLMGGAAYAEQSVSTMKDVWLKVKPGRCIALHQGQNCYQTLEFSWQAPAGEHCLIEKQQLQPLTCSNSGGPQSYKFQFKSSESKIFAIRSQAANEVLAEVTVEVAWVYKTKRNRSGWRLF